MSAYDALRQPAADLAPGNPFVLARHILRDEGELTIQQFHELDGLLHRLNPAQFHALTDDPLHQIRLRKYEALSWRQCRPAALTVSLLIGIAALASTIVVLLLR